MCRILRGRPTNQTKSICSRRDYQSNSPICKRIRFGYLLQVHAPAKTKPGDRIWLPGQGRGLLPQRRPYAGFVAMFIFTFCSFVNIVLLGCGKSAIAIQEFKVRRTALGNSVSRNSFPINRRQGRDGHRPLFAPITPMTGNPRRLERRPCHGVHGRPPIPFPRPTGYPPASIR